MFVVKVVVNDMSNFLVAFKILTLGMVEHVVINKSDFGDFTVKCDEFVPEKKLIHVDVAVLNDMLVNFSA